MKYLNKKSEILREAKKYIWDGEEENTSYLERFICLAIEFRILPNEAPLCKKDEIVKLILSRLGKDKHGDYLTVYEYLRDVLGIPKKKLTSKAVQKYRLAWVNELIREFEAGGD